MQLFYGIELGVYLLAGHVQILFGKLADEVFKSVELCRVDTCVMKAQRLGKAMLAVKAGIVYRQKSDVCRAGDAEAFSVRLASVIGVSPN